MGTDAVTRVDVSSWTRSLTETLGQSEKYWLKRPADAGGSDELWLFKPATAAIGRATTPARNWLMPSPVSGRRTWWS